MDEFRNKAALITGGNSGIGFATAKELIKRGANVIITGRRKDAVEKAAMELNAVGLVADQSVMGDIARLAQEVAGRYGKIDLLLINAGIIGLSKIESADEAMFDEIMNVNFKGAYFTLSKFIPLLNENASIVLLSSTSASISPPGASVYAASKAALNAVMKIAAVELASRKIRVNAVSPGPVSTEIMNKIALSREVEDKMVGTIPMARLGKPGEVAKVISFLLSEDASFVTGSEYLVDGGQCV